MAGHAGLHRVVKTVKGKKGSAHRAYWVKNDAGPAAHPGIMHRAAVLAGKAALAATAVAATAYLAHKAGSHMAKWGGGGSGRGLAAHASLVAGAAAHSLPAKMHSASTAAHSGISTLARGIRNAASNSSIAHAISDHRNIHAAAAHATKMAARHSNDMQELRLLKHSMGHR